MWTVASFKYSTVEMDGECLKHRIENNFFYRLALYYIICTVIQCDLQPLRPGRPRAEIYELF